VQDSIEDTHASYNNNMKHILENLKENDMLFVASHNNDTVELTKKLMASNE
jgi:GTP-sensing pleiotropic transcriptional regulator CodY